MTPGTFLRRFWGVTTAAVLGVAFLTGLGTWQLKRLSWKEALIETLSTRWAAPRVPLEAFLEKRGEPEDPSYQRVTLKGRYLHEQEAHLLGRTHEGQVVYHIVTPFLLSSGTVILMDRGWVPAKISASDPGLDRPEGDVEEKAHLRLKSSTTFVTPPNRYEAGELYAILPQEFAAAHSMATLVPFFAVREGLSEAYPRPQTTALPTLRNNHLTYAITWYILALALIVVYVLFIRQRLQKSGHLK